MNAIRTMVLALVTAVGLASPAGFLPSVAANDPLSVRHHYYYVAYRSCPNEPWRYYGPLGGNYVQRVVANLRAGGYDAFAVRYR